eukprot:TRINITY_DN6674_c0_g1_i1.p1 TRINITY_DN6674_c0_g1~~TRINITY_DN6674_c0_g1_i1.p1  ORF type:complete len:288 (+),score=53.70 TRINITY_DN6674_c0_g1_i1:171-1034(+)
MNSVHPSLERLLDSLVEQNILHSPPILEAMKKVDRAAFLPAENRAEAYYDQPIRSGIFHLSAPNIYVRALENLSFGRGMSFLNVGSGTGYFSSVVAQLIGSKAKNHGIEIEEELVEFAKSHSDGSITFVRGNALLLNTVDPIRKYDRIYIGVGLETSQINSLRRLLNVNGVMVVPDLNENKFMRIKYLGGSRFASSLISVARFAVVKEPTHAEKLMKLDIYDESHETISSERRSAFSLVPISIPKAHPRTVVACNLEEKTITAISPLPNGISFAGGSFRIPKQLLVH